MKKLVTIVALAVTAFSAPALARNSARAAAPTAWEQSYAQEGARGAYAQDRYPAQSANPRFDVYTDGQYRGSDPSFYVRQELRDDDPNNS